MRWKQSSDLGHGIRVAKHNGLLRKQFLDCGESCSCIARGYVGKVYLNVDKTVN